MPNPGRMAVGIVLTAPDGGYYAKALRLQGTGCNNEAELQALRIGLAEAKAREVRCLRIYTDSQWLVQQLAQAPHGAQRARKTMRLQSQLAVVQGILQTLEHVHWRWVPRHCNAQADALAREAHNTCSKC